MADNRKQMLLRGITSSPKYIPTWYNYDETGSELNEKCTTENPDYYLSRGEMSILQHNMQDIIPMVPYDLTLVDLGSGNCSKTRLVIDELLKRQEKLLFYPEDICEDFLMKTAEELSEEYGDSLVVTPIAADYVKGIEQLKQIEGAKIILWIGSMINLPYNDQVKILKLISTIMTGNCRLVFSADITQARDDILKAYDDDAGLMRNFVQNGITRLNKETGSQIQLDRFTWEVDFVSNKDPHSMSYVRKYMRAKDAVQYEMPELDIDFKMEIGERLYFHEGAGYSCKYTLEQLQNMIKKAGLRLADTWMDEQEHVVFCGCTTV